MAVLTSKIAKFFLKNIIGHTVHTQVEELKQLPLILKTDEKIVKLVSEIIAKQKSNPRYAYMTNEQIEIDRLVYEMYNLNADDIKEVEDWYWRRYPKLAKVIEEKLKRKNNG